VAKAVAVTALCLTSLGLAGFHLFADLAQVLGNEDCALWQRARITKNRDKEVMVTEVFAGTCELVALKTYWT
jgi:hypothetical protein